MPGRKPLPKALRMVLGYALVIILLIAAVRVVNTLTAPPSSKLLPITLPADIAKGKVGEPVISGSLTLKVTDVQRIPSLPAAKGLKPSSRADPMHGANDYLILTLSLKNTGKQPVPFAYYGLSPHVRFALGIHNPTPAVVEAALPRDAELLTGQPAFPNATLEPGAEHHGVVVFAVRTDASGLNLLLLPQEPGNDQPGNDQAGNGPAFEVALP
jgi:hypothetical protein